eukprot:CAMPEP_0183466568 /NCGR_PEP_ID=MMETSP0370-20130417/149326_1 /TAXON_ID=268820 /ORGANISM="Peridinium aciculiferum, Strain PAER-2" /LENGTH=246 /DNA_ID=CAMNT_0025658853 /DNA_START=30 /DNA_END=771 /DNA_ORIENTATION=+
MLRHPAHNGPSGRHRQCWMGKQVSVREVRRVGRVDLEAQRLPRASGERGRPGPVPGCHQQASRCPLDMPTTGGAQTREQPKHRPIDDTELGKRHTRPQRHTLEEQPRRTLVLLARTSQHVRRVIAGNPSASPISASILRTSATVSPTDASISNCPDRGVITDSRSPPSPRAGRGDFGKRCIKCGARAASGPWGTANAEAAAAAGKLREPTAQAFAMPRGVEDAERAGPVDACRGTGGGGARGGAET